MVQALAGRIERMPGYHGTQLQLIASYVANMELIDADRLRIYNERVHDYLTPRAGAFDPLPKPQQPPDMVIEVLWDPPDTTVMENGLSAATVILKQGTNADGSPKLLGEPCPDRRPLEPVAGFVDFGVHLWGVYWQSGLKDRCEDGVEIEPSTFQGPGDFKERPAGKFRKQRHFMAFGDPSREDHFIGYWIKVS